MAVWAMAGGMFFFPNSAIAQSVLESVLGRLNLGQDALLGSFSANMAINTGWHQQDVALENAGDDVIVALIYGDYFDPASGTSGQQVWAVTVGDLGTTLLTSETLFWEDISIGLDGTISATDSNISLDRFEVYDVKYNHFGTVDDGAASAPTTVLAIPAGTDVYTDGTDRFLLTTDVARGAGYIAAYDDVYDDFGVNASILNVLSATGDVNTKINERASSLELVTSFVTIGQVSTTGLGAVNTGAIHQGVSSAVNQSSAGLTIALHSINQLNGSTFGQVSVSWNEAYNDQSIDASVQNRLSAISGALGTTSTTALGAVNTGGIISGIETTMRDIVGLSGS